MFTHLHLHTEYSLLDGAIRIKGIGKKLKERGFTAAAITDHGNMHGVIEFYKELKSAGLKPLIGCEVYVAPHSRFDKKVGMATDEKNYNHLILIARTNEGYQNLCRMVSLGYTEGMYYKPRIDKELISKYGKGIICLSACIAGSIPQAILRGDMDKAIEDAKFFKESFDDFYIEVQRHGIPEEEAVLSGLIEIAKTIGSKVVATNDCHYLEKSDAEMQDVMLCMQTKATINQERRMKFATDEFYVKSEQEMLDLFPNNPEFISNTEEIVDKCNVEIEFGNIKLPDYEIPEGFEDHFAYLRWLAENGMKKRYGESVPKEYIDRMNYELDIINNMGFVGYYLIVWDFINWAKEHDIPIGPGRGSGAGSIVAYAIGITNLDPMKYNLLFERFLNPERVSMPDFDVDMCFERRQEIVDYVTRKYGDDRVSKIVTYGTLAAKSAVLDVGRVYEYPDDKVQKISGLIPQNADLATAMEQPELKREYETDPVAKRILDMAIKLEGMPKYTSTHAAGVLIADKPITNYAPLCVTKDGDVAIQFPMTTLEEIGLVKMDFLGLRTITAIKQAENEIRKNVPNFNIEDIPLDDKETFAMISAGDTAAVFQFESDGMRSVLTQLKPTSMEDLIAVISLYRPGPMDSIPKYIENRHHPDKIVYADPRLKNIMDVTYGCLVYQEQVMQLFRDLAGFSFGRADIVRRGMAKKKLKIIEEEKKHFIYGMKDDDGNVIIEGALVRGVSEKVASDLMDQMTAFASYAFNKSHAAAYAKVAYQTAYLKCHFPKQYIASHISTLIDGADSSKFKSACMLCRETMGIAILPPDVNKSQVVFSVDDKGVRYGLSAISNLNRDFANAIVSEREVNGKYKSLFDFVYRVHSKYCQKSVCESLIKSGAMDFTKETRAQMLANVSNIMSTVKSIKGTINSEKQYSVYSMFDDESLKQMCQPRNMIEIDDEMDKLDLLSGEMSATRIYFSGHPLENYSKAIKELGFKTIKSLSDLSLSKPLTVALPVRIYGIKRKMSKNKKQYASCMIEDQTSTVGAVAFGSFLEKQGLEFKDDTIKIAECSIKQNRADSEEKEVIINALYSIPANDDKNYDKQIENIRQKIGQLLTRRKVVSVKNTEKNLKKRETLVVCIEDLNNAEKNEIYTILSQYPGIHSVVCIDRSKRTKAMVNLKVNITSDLIEEIQKITDVSRMTI